MTDQTSDGSRIPGRQDTDHDQWLRDLPGPVGRFFAPVAGYGVTISSMFRPTVTELYPFEPPVLMPRYHGRHQLNRYDVYQINYLRCIFCGMCIEACPTRALTMTHEIEELVGPNRTGLIYEKQDLLAPVPRGALAAPHPMVEGTEDGDYYRGAVTGVTREQIDWVRAHRPEDPTLESAKPVPAPTPAKEAVRR